MMFLIPSSPGRRRGEHGHARRERIGFHRANTCSRVRQTREHANTCPRVCQTPEYVFTCLPNTRTRDHVFAKHPNTRTRVHVSAKHPNTCSRVRVFATLDTPAEAVFARAGPRAGGRQAGGGMMFLTPSSPGRRRCEHGHARRERIGFHHAHTSMTHITIPIGQDLLHAGPRPRGGGCGVHAGGGGALGGIYGGKGGGARAPSLTHARPCARPRARARFPKESG